MTIFEKAKEIIKNKEVPYDETYHGIAFIYYMELITRQEYTKLIKLLED